MSNARDKLDESRYFLQRMAESASNRDHFRYNLSAFLSAARSVTFLMQAEFKHGTPGFSEWYSNKQPGMDSDAMMRFFNQKRVIALHQEPVQPRAEVGISLAGTVTPTGSVSLVVIRGDGSVEYPESTESGTAAPPPSQSENAVREPEWHWYFADFPGTDVMRLCEQHISKLEALVSECESRFSPPPDPNV